MKYGKKVLNRKSHMRTDTSFVKSLAFIMLMAGKCSGPWGTIILFLEITMLPRFLKWLGIWDTTQKEILSKGDIILNWLFHISWRCELMKIKI